MNIRRANQQGMGMGFTQDGSTQPQSQPGEQGQGVKRRGPVPPAGPPPFQPLPSVDLSQFAMPAKRGEWGMDGQLMQRLMMMMQGGK